MKERAEPSPALAWNGELLVDDDPRHELRAAASMNASLDRILGEALCLADLVDPPEEASKIHLRLGREREGQVVGVPRVLCTDLLGERGETRIEPPAHDVRDRGRRRRALRQRTGPDHLAVG